MRMVFRFLSLVYSVHTKNFKHCCVTWWAEPDSNRRPFDYQSNAPAVLSYRPSVQRTKSNDMLVNKNFRKSFNCYTSLFFVYGPVV